MNAAVATEVTTPMGAAAERARELGAVTASVDAGHDLDLAVMLVELPGIGDWWALASRYEPATGTQVMREAICDAPIDAVTAATQLERAPWMDELAHKAGAL